MGRNMRLLRAERGLSQEALAHESGINRTYLSSVERSERNVSIDNIERIADALNVEPWELLRESKARRMPRSGDGNLPSDVITRCWDRRPRSPLLASGIGGLGLLGWRRKRKAAANAP